MKTKKNARELSKTKLTKTNNNSQHAQQIHKPIKQKLTPTNANKQSNKTTNVMEKQ